MSVMLTAGAALLAVAWVAFVAWAVSVDAREAQARADEDSAGTVTWPGPEPRRRYTK